MEKAFAYTMRGRVIWISQELFHIPVVDDLYRIHQVDASALNQLESCTHFVVEYFHKFAPNTLVASPNTNDDSQEIQLAHEKIKAFIKLNDYVNYSYQASLPLVFTSEEDKIEALASSLLDNNYDQDAAQKHLDFIRALVLEKKAELKKRYLDLMYQIKKARSLEELKHVTYKIVFEGINVV